MSTYVRGVVRGFSVAIVFTAAAAGVMTYRTRTAKAAGPYFYGCTPAQAVGNFAINSGFNTLFIYNPGAVTATVFRKLLNKDGSNRSTLANPSGGFYPGESQGQTVTVAAGTTLPLRWDSAGGDPGTTAGDTIASIKVMSDQPVFVSLNVGPNQFTVLSCPQLMQ
jgi:hypothetical protein